MGPVRETGRGLAFWALVSGWRREGGEPNGLFGHFPSRCEPLQAQPEDTMHSIIYLVGLVVVVVAILSFLGVA